MRNVTLALRMIGKHPGPSLAVIGTLALAIGANAAVFSVVEATVLAPLPYRAPGELLLLTSVRRERVDAVFSLPELRDYATGSKALSGVAAYANWSANLTGEAEAERLQGMRISANVFDVLGARPAIGRLLVPTDDEANAPRVVVISHGFWQRQFGARADVLGRSLRLNAEPYTVVGVMPEGTMLPIRSVDVAVPLAPARDPWRDDRASPNFLRFIARLAPNNSVEQATDELNRISAQLKERYPAEYASKMGVHVTGLQAAMLGDTRQTGFLLLGAVVVVLGVACANLANLLLLRASSRGREMAIRRALGASTGNIASQLATETGVLAILGGALGLAVGYGGLRLIVRFGPVGVPRLADAAISAPVVAYTAGLTLLVAIGLGVACVLKERRPSVESLRSGRAATPARRQLRARATMVAAEVASALVLLVGAGLLAESLVQVQRADIGFKPHGLFVARVSLPRGPYASNEHVKRFMERMAGQLSQQPAVTTVGAVSVAPFTGLLATVNFAIAGQAPRPDGGVLTASYRLATPAYFEAMQIPLRRGRVFDDHDRSGTLQVAVVSQAFVNRFLDGADPIGRQIIIEPTSPVSITAEIVGVVGNVRHTATETTPAQDIYLAAGQLPADDAVWLANNQFWMIRMRGDPSAFAATFRDALRVVEPDAAASDMGSLERYVDAAIGPRRFTLDLMLLFALAAAALAGTGVYAVLGYAVAQRRREIAVRLALGATPGSIRTLILKQGLLPVAVGMGVGIGIALMAGPAVAGLLYGVHPADWTVFAGASLMLSAIALAAIAGPAFRAGSTNSMLVIQVDG